MSSADMTVEVDQLTEARGRGTFINKDVWDSCKACSPQVKCLAQFSLVFYVSFVQILFIYKFTHDFLIYWLVSEFIHVW